MNDKFDGRVRVNVYTAKSDTIWIDLVEKRNQRDQMVAFTGLTRKQARKLAKALKRAVKTSKRHADW